MSDFTEPTQEVVTKVVDRYLEIVKSNDSASNVIEALRDLQGSTEIVYELGDVAAELGYGIEEVDDDGDAWTDRWWAALAKSRPRILACLLYARGGLFTGQKKEQP